MFENGIPLTDEIQSDGSWHITDPGAAEWALTKIAELRAERDRKIEAAEAMIARHEAIIRLANDDCSQHEAFFVRELREWFETQPKRSLKASYAVDLPSGKLSLDKAPKREFNRDKDRLAAFVRENAPEYSKVTYDTDWAKLKSHITVQGGVCVLDSTGEIVDGVTVTETPPEFKVKI